MHKAVVAKIDALNEIPGANAIQVAHVLGECVVVNKNAQVGDVGVFFQPELQLSEDFCSNNNLFRDKERNKDKEKAGFFDSTRRVRAQPFMKVKSMGFFVPFSNFDYTGKVNLKVGDQFDELNGHKICQKYISEKTLRAMGNKNTKARKKMEVPDFKEHLDTEQFKYNANRIPKGALISITAKLHGTSARYGKMKVYEELPKWKRLVNKVYPIFPGYKWDYVAGTRRVVLKTQDKDKDGFHGSEAFRFEWLDILKPHLSEGLEVYGELVGYANGKPIMPEHDIKSLKDKAFTQKYGDNVVYKYGCLEGENKFYVYRITLTNSDGETIDFTYPQIVSWCQKRGIDIVPEVCKPFIYDGNEEKLRNLVAELTEREDCLSEDYIDHSHVSEGVVIRADYVNMQPMLMKSKSYAFRVMEGICDAIDPEDAEGEIV